MPGPERSTDHVNPCRHLLTVWGHPARIVSGYLFSLLTPRRFTKVLRLLIIYNLHKTNQKGESKEKNLVCSETTRFQSFCDSRKIIAKVFWKIVEQVLWGVYWLRCITLFRHKITLLVHSTSFRPFLFLSLSLSLYPSFSTVSTLLLGIYYSYRHNKRFIQFYLYTST